MEKEQTVMDERIVKILREMAYGEVQQDDCGCTCHYCNGDEIYDWHSILIDHIAHESTCPIILARDVLRERGTPLKVYNVTWEYIPGYSKHMSVKVLNSKPRGTVNQLVGGYSEEEIRAKLPEGKEYNRYNVQLTFVKCL